MSVTDITEKTQLAYFLISVARVPFHNNMPQATNSGDPGDSSMEGAL